ncbi:MAG: DHA2 family efflux MFS transporter permease subunit [Candidatus Entotheonellia bacterium]
MTSPLNDRVRWGAAISLLLGMVAFAFSVSTLTIAIPSIMAGLRADVDRVQWVVTSFDMTQTVVMPTVGWLGGILGNRNLFLTGIGISLIGGTLGGLSWSLEALIVFQIVQGIGAGLMQPTLTAILYGLFPPQRRGLAVALTMTAFGVGPTLGPIIAGYMVEYLSWRATFYIQVPIILASFVLTLMTMPNIIERRVRTIDFPGLITMSVFLVCLLLALTQGHKEEWTSRYIMSLFAISGAAFVLFVVIELSVADPVVDLRLYRSFPFSMGCLLAFLNTLVFRGAGFLMGIFVQYTLQYTPIQAGFMTAPSGIAFGSMSYLSGKLSDRFGPRLPIIIGMLLFIGTFFWYADMNRWSTTFVILQVMALRPFAYGWTNSPTNFAALRALPDNEVRMGSGLFSLVRGIASSFGVAMGATFLATHAERHVLRFSEDAGHAVDSLRDTLGDIQGHLSDFGELGPMQLTKSLALLNQFMREEAIFASYQDIFIVGGILSVVALVPVFFLPGGYRVSKKR